MAHFVKCYYCGGRFDRDKVECVAVNSRRYAHVECSMSETEKLTKEEQDKRELEEYIMKLFKTSYVEPRVQKQIKQYKEEYNYTYSGIKKALIYFFEVKGNSIDKANGGIGIVPYTYQAAFNYYFALWEAQQKNENKIVQEYVPNVKEIIISRPTCRVKKKPYFSFLDEEQEVSHGQ